MRGSYLQRALAQAPESPEVLAAAGRVCRSAGKNRKAEQYFRASLAAQQRQAAQLDNGLPSARGTAAVASSGRPLNPFSGMTGAMPRSPAVLSEHMDGGNAYDAAARAPTVQLAPVATPPTAARFATAAPVNAYTGTSGDALPQPVSASAVPSTLPAPSSRLRASTRNDVPLLSASDPQPRAIATHARTACAQQRQ
ncbi:hypothetical protein [Xanthomonas nasturtii]|uniref:Tetratricopeptide repeat protein n=1 Tax=Xanthomonas nasturtii TaxID=1843581 RepID=A0ABT0LRU0_9XANT|nr:hypothetical protein [Xanthomonas nasturtii]MCL1554281.1 hypothetical protein [Xanthomonas nasturtii]